MQTKDYKTNLVQVLVICKYIYIFLKTPYLK